MTHGPGARAQSTQVLAPGQEFGGYAIKGPLGKGGMAEVYEAIHLILERTVAIKVLNPALNVDPTFPLRFLREAKTVARLSHPNIITVFDFKDKGDLAYLVMELAANGTLRDRARHFRTLSDAVDALAPVCEALQFAHERGVVHRDVKCNNVLINDHGQPLLADFGLARVVEESLDFTLLGTSAGSPHYMAPEQAMGEEVDHRADLYALGIMAFEVIGGRLPFTGKTPTAIMQQHVNAPPPSIRQVLPDAPARLEAAIERATAKRPEDRFPSAAAFLAELRAAAAEAPDLPIRAGRSGAVAVSPTSAGAGERRPPTALASPDDDVADATIVDGDDEFVDATIVDFEPLPRADVAVPATVVATSSGSVDLASRPAPDIEALPGWRRAGSRKRRRPSAFTVVEWGALAVVVLALLGLVGLCAWAAFSSPRSEAGLAGLASALFARLAFVRDLLALTTVLLGLLNATFMRVAVLADYHISQRTYQRLRQYHRFVGYTTGSIAIAVQALTWLEIGTIGMPPARAGANLVVGTALLLLFVSKVAVVRYVPRLRVYLAWFGIGLAVLALSVLLINVVPLLWTA